MEMASNTKAFFLEGNREGCLLIHGFTGSAAHMYPLGRYLNDKGFTVYGVLLKGHGTTLDDMEKASHKDWINSVIDGYNTLKEKCDRIYVMGLSMGGVLSLILSGSHQVDKVIAISTPIKIQDKLAKFTPLFKYFKRYKPWSSNSTTGSYGRSLGYDKIPLKSVPELLKLMKTAKKALDSIKCPILIIQPEGDKYVKLSSVDIIYNNVGSSSKDILWLKNSPHSCTLGPERDLIHERIYDFITTP